MQKKALSLAGKGGRLLGEVLPGGCDLPGKVHTILTEAGTGGSAGE